MIQNEGKTQLPRPNADNLEPYRRMVVMQRQIIELVKLHEQSKRECEELRDQVAHEIDMFCSPRQRWFYRTRNLVLRLWHRVRQLGTRVKRSVENTEIFPSSQQSSET